MEKVNCKKLSSFFNNFASAGQVTAFSAAPASVLAAVTNLGA